MKKILIIIALVLVLSGAIYLLRNRKNEQKIDAEQSNAFLKEFRFKVADGVIYTYKNDFQIGRIKVGVNTRHQAGNYILVFEAQSDKETKLSVSTVQEAKPFYTATFKA